MAHILVNGTQSICKVRPRSMERVPCEHFTLRFHVPNNWVPETFGIMIIRTWTLRVVFLGLWIFHADCTLRHLQLSRAG